MAEPYVYDPSALRDVFDKHFTFTAGFWRNVHRYAERLAMLDPASGRSWTYRELGEDVRWLAAGLAARGVGPRDVITFQLFNTPEFALLYLAAQRLRAIAAPVNFRFSPGETAHVLDDSQPKAHVFDASLADATQEALALTRHRPTLLVTASGDAGEGMVPFGIMLESSGADLRGIVTMGAPLEQAACLRYQRVLTSRIFNGYGTTETFWNTFLRPADLPEHAGSAGRACTDDDVAVAALTADGSPGSPDELVPQDGATVGEVVMRSVKSGYAYVHNPAGEAARFRGGWVFTGDLATWDSLGYVTIVGRKDDMIISGGENVHPVQVEEVLNEHPLVRESLVVGVPDTRWGEVVVAYVVPAEEGLTAAECDKHCLAHPMLANFKRPRGYKFVASLPRTATGKLMHYKLRDEARDGTGLDEFERP